MSRRRKLPFPDASALFAWNGIALKWMEMMAASSQVIAHRTSRSNTPAQIFRMGNEKVLAGLEAAHAMAPGLMKLPAAGGADAWNAWLRLFQSGMRPYHARATRNARQIRGR